MHTHAIRMIYNPQADRGRSYQMAGDLHQLSNEWGGADWVGTVYPGHATELALAAAQAGYGTVVALGGDGTVHEVVNGLMQVEEATQRIRERPWGRGVAIIALTGWGQDGDRERSREAGCDGHLVKPVDLADLARALTDLADG
jgi:DNA-binding NarL/FixJ family response regulator